MTESQKNWKLISPFIKGLPVIIIAVIIGVMAGSRYLRYSKPEYESTSQIRLADINEGPSSSSLFNDYDVFSQTNKVEEEQQVIKSRIIIDKALDSLKLDKVEYCRIGRIKTTDMYDETPFIVNTNAADSLLYNVNFPITFDAAGFFSFTDPTDHQKKYIGHMGDTIQMRSGTICISRNDDIFKRKPDLQLADNYSFKIKNRESLISEISSNLDVTSADKDVAVLRITYKSPVPKECADVVNAISQAYIRDYIENKVRTADKTVKFIDDQLSSISGQLTGSEDTIETFRNNNDIINLSQQTESDLNSVSQMKIQLADLQMEMAAVDSLVDYLQTNKNDFLAMAPNFQSFNDLLSTELVKQIKDLQAQKTDLLTKYTPNSPNVKAIDDKIDDITSYILESCKNTQRSLKIKYDEVSGAIAQQDKSFDNVPYKEKELASLQRNFDLDEKMYNFLNEKKMEAEIDRAANISFHRIIDPGVVPSTPVSPNRLFILALCGFIGLIIGIILVYIWDSIGPGIKNTNKVEKNSGLPLGGVLGFLKRKEKAMHAFRKLLFDLKFKGALKHGNTICVSSYSNQCGKSFIAENLAKVFVQDHFLTLLITCDREESGLSEMEMYATMDHLSLNPGFLYRLNLNEEDILTHDFERLIPFIQLQFQTILIDNASIENSLAAIGLMRQSQQNMIVLDTFRTSSQTLSRIEMFCAEYKVPNPFFLLNRAGANIFTVLLSKLSFRKNVAEQEPDFLSQLYPAQS